MVLRKISIQAAVAALLVGGAAALYAAVAPVGAPQSIAQGEADDEHGDD